MPKLPVVTGEDAVRAFLKAGFELHHVTGSHHVLRREGNRDHLSIPVHKGKTLGKGLLRSLIKASGLTVEQFIQNL